MKIVSQSDKGFIWENTFKILSPGGTSRGPMACLLVEFEVHFYLNDHFVGSGIKGAISPISGLFGHSVLSVLVSQINLSSRFPQVENSFLKFLFCSYILESTYTFSTEYAIQ